MHSHLRSRGAVVLEVALLVAFIGTIATLSQLKSEVAQERARAQHAAAEAGASGGAGKEGKASGEQRQCVNGEAYKTEVKSGGGGQTGSEPSVSAKFVRTREPLPDHTIDGVPLEPCDLTFCGPDGKCYTVKVPPGGDLDKELDSKSGLPGATARWGTAVRNFDEAAKSGDAERMAAARRELAVGSAEYRNAVRDAFGLKSNEFDAALKGTYALENNAGQIMSAAQGEGVGGAGTEDFSRAAAAQRVASADLMKKALGEPQNFARLADASREAPRDGVIEHPDASGTDHKKSGNEQGSTFYDAFGTGHASEEAAKKADGIFLDKAEKANAAFAARKEYEDALAYRASCRSWNFWDPGCRKDTVDKARAYQDTVYTNAGLKTPEEVEGRGAASGSAPAAGGEEKGGDVAVGGARTKATEGKAGATPAPVVAVNSAGEARVGGGTSGVGATNQDGWVTEDGTPLEDLGREEYERNLKDAKVALEKAKAATPLCTSGWMCTGASKDNLRKAQEAVDAAEERLQEFEATNGVSTERVADAKKEEDDAKKEFDAVMRGERNGPLCFSSCIAENERKAREAYEAAKARREALEGAGYKTGETTEGRESSLGKVSAQTKTVLAAAEKAEHETSASLTRTIDAYSDPKNATVGDRDLDKAIVGSWEAQKARVVALENALNNDSVPLGDERARLQKELSEAKKRLGDFESDYGKDELDATKKKLAADEALRRQIEQREVARRAAAEEAARADAARRAAADAAAARERVALERALGGNGANPLSSLLSGLQKAMGGQQKQGGAKGGGGSGGQQNPNTAACTQWPGTTLQNGQCTCPTGQSWNGSACAQQNQCAQYPGTTLVNNQCTCPQGQNWTGAKCEDVGGTANTLKAQLACSPKVQEPGEKIALSYSCENANTIRADGFTITGNRMSGELEVVATTTDATDGRMKFALTCAKEGKIEEARCEVAVSKAFIVLVATPSTVESGKPTKIGWITGGMKASDDACSLKKKGASDVLKQGRSSVYETPGITGETTYVLSCTTAAGFSKTAEVTVKVR